MPLSTFLFLLLLVLLSLVFKNSGRNTDAITMSAGTTTQSSQRDDDDDDEDGVDIAFGGFTVCLL